MCHCQPVLNIRLQYTGRMRDLFPLGDVLDKHTLTTGYIETHKIQAIIVTVTGVVKDMTDFSVCVFVVGFMIMCVCVCVVGSMPWCVCVCPWRLYGQ